MKFLISQCEFRDLLFDIGYSFYFSFLFVKEIRFGIEVSYFFHNLVPNDDCKLSCCCKNCRHSSFAEINSVKEIFQQEWSLLNCQLHWRNFEVQFSNGYFLLEFCLTTPCHEQSVYHTTLLLNKLETCSILRQLADGKNANWSLTHQAVKGGWVYWFPEKRCRARPALVFSGNQQASSSIFLISLRTMHKKYISQNAWWFIYSGSFCYRNTLLSPRRMSLFN